MINQSFQGIVDKVNALSFRERMMVIITIAVLAGFLWWNLFALQALARTEELSQKNKSLELEINTLDLTTASFQQRLNEGVFKTKEQKLKLLELEFQRVSDLLNEKMQVLIEPGKMFELMQELITAESKLKLTSMKRKSVESVFISENEGAQEPEIYQHVLQMSFEGSYKNILKYIQKMEGLEWKLIWDRIILKSSQYPIISVNIEISTLSDNKNWVGL